MKIYGSFYVGNSYHTELTPDMNAEREHIAEIEQKIRALRPLLDEYVVVDLKRADGSENTPAYFQTTRSRAYRRSPEDRYLFTAEIGIRGTDGEREGTWLYRKEELPCEEAVRLFYEICVERKAPDLQKWVRHESLFSDKQTAKERREERIIDRCKILFNQCMVEEVSGALGDAVLLEALERLCREYLLEYSPFFVGLCHFYGCYAGLEQMIDDCPQDAVLAAAKADLLHEGRLAPPDLKGAYDLYVHAARTGSLRAALMVARAFRDGWLAPPDLDRYAEIVQSLYEFCANYDAEYTLFALPEVVFELSRIEEKHGNTEKAIEFCLHWKEMSLMCACNTCYPSKYDEQIVLQLYRLTEFEPSEMDLLDLFYVLRSPCKARIFLEGDTEIEVEAVRYEDEVIVKCGEFYFRDTSDFFKKYRLDGKRITAYVDKILYITTEETL